MRKFIYGIMVVFVLFMTGCADAGKDQSVVSSEVVTLDASASKADFFGEIKKYRWKQVKGSKVALSDIKAVKPTFTAPSVSQKTTLIFHLVTKEMGGYYSPWKTKDQVTIIVNPISTENKLPQALVSANSETIKYGESVTFDASASTDSDGEIVSYEWTDAVGGILGSGVTLAHVFDSVGTHTVTLTVTDNEGATSTASLTVTVNALQKPLADINASATVVLINDTVTFDGNTSSDSDGEIISYTWTDVQGNVLSNMVGFTHTFATSGEYNITLSVMDDDEQIGTSTVSITVEALLLSVSLSSTVSSLEVNETTELNTTAHYNDSTTVPVSSSVEWIVGDTNILTIDANGTLKALQSGSTSIMAKVGEIESNIIIIEVIPQDTTPPILTLNGEADLTLIQGTPYTELGVTATDDRDENVTVTQTGTVDVNILGTYVITYTATDKAGNTATIQRTVNVVLPPDVTPPVIALNGESVVTLFQGVSYVELGATAIDDRDTNISVSISGNVDSATLGSYIITYSATDTAGNSATAQRTVNIVLPPDTKAPVITLNGDVNITLTQGESYEELGARASDERDGDVNVIIEGSVDTSTVGTYTITYTATDNAGNATTATRTVTVVAPTLTNLNLESNVTTLNVGEKAELTVMATYSDGSTSELDANIEYIITPSDSVDVNGSVITAKKDSNVTVQAKVGTTLSNTLNLTIAWVVNGHTLPPEPDKTLNDSTLLGVDVNDNGVRDDVERWIYEEYKDKHPIYVDIGMQASRGYKLILETPERAKEIHSKVRKARHCEAYYRYSAKYFNEPILIKSDFSTTYLRKKLYFNTQERKDAYMQYDTLLSGGSYTLPSDKERKDACDFNTTKYEK